MESQTLYDALEATWPPAAARRVGPWKIREGKGGGKRVSAATAEESWRNSDIADAEAAMRNLDQPLLFMIREGDDELDAGLAGLGYGIVDPVVLYAVPVRKMTGEPLAPLSTFQVYPPLAVMIDLWAAGGVGSERVAVMNRIDAPGTGLFARHADQPAGVGFVAAHGAIAMVHALEVQPEHRRQGVGSSLLREAAFWAKDEGAEHLALAVTRANAAANALYASLGFAVAGHYHYRIK